MAGEWEAAKWGDIAVLDYGKSLRGYSETTGKARVYGTNGPIGWHDEALWQAPGVIVGRKGAYRGVHYATDPYWVIDTAYSLRPKRELNLRWVYYQLKHLDVNTIDDGSPIPSTTRDAFYVQDVLVPPRSHQDRIAELLGSLDDKIELNRRMAATLQELARALFKSWFVDFDPVRAKAEGRDPDLPAATAALFSDTFGDDGLPMGWTMKKVADGCCAIFSGGTPSTSEPDFWNGTLPWLSSGETRNRFVTNTEKKITQQAIDNSSTRLARRGSTVIASAGQGNTRGQTSFLLLDTHINQSVVALQANTAVSSDLFLFFELERRYDEFRRVSDGQSSRGSLTTKLIGSLPAVCPGRSLVAAFDVVVQPLVDRIEGALEQAEGLRAIRDALLPKLISGELRIKDAKNVVEAA